MLPALCLRMERAPSRRQTSVWHRPHKAVLFKWLATVCTRSLERALILPIDINLASFTLLKSGFVLFTSKVVYSSKVIRIRRCELLTYVAQCDVHFDEDEQHNRVVRLWQQLIQADRRL